MRTEGNQRFRFRLQSVLDVKKKLEESAKERLAFALAQKQLKDERLENIRRRMERAKKEMIQEIENGIETCSLAIPCLWIIRLGEESKKAEKEAMEAAQDVEKRKEEFLLISQEVDLLESLRQRYLESYIEEDRRNGIKILDDIASIRFQNQGKEEDEMPIKAMEREEPDEGDKLD